MHDLFGFRSIEEELIMIAVLSVILIILLIYEHRKKRLEKKQGDLNDLIFDIGMFINHQYKRWRKK